MIKNNKFRGLAAAAAVAALFTAQPAAADVIEIDSFWGGSQAVSFSYNGGDWHSTQAGGFSTINTTTGEVFQSFCVDIFDTFGWGAASESTQSPAAAIIGTQAATDLGRLYTSHHAAIAAHSGNAEAEAAFQLAVWEIVYDQNQEFGYNLGAGRFVASGGSQGLAQSWLNALASPSDNFTSPTIWMAGIMTTDARFPGEHPQDVVTFTPVPEPETYAMMLVGLGLLGFSARRKSQF